MRSMLSFLSILGLLSALGCSTTKIRDYNKGLKENELKVWYINGKKIDGPTKLIIAATASGGVLFGVKGPKKVIAGMGKRELWHFKNALLKAKQWIGESHENDVDLNKEVPNKSPIKINVGTQKANFEGKAVRSAIVSLALKDLEVPGKKTVVLLHGINKEYADASGVIVKGDMIEKLLNIINNVPEWSKKQADNQRLKKNLFN